MSGINKEENRGSERERERERQEVKGNIRIATKGTVKRTKSRERRKGMGPRTSKSREIKQLVTLHPWQLSARFDYVFGLSSTGNGRVASIPSSLYCASPSGGISREGWNRNVVRRS